MSHDKATLLQIFIWGLEKDLAEKLSTAHPKTILSAIDIADNLELSIHFAHRSPLKGAVAVSSRLGTQVSGGEQQT